MNETSERKSYRCELRRRLPDRSRVQPEMTLVGAAIGRIRLTWDVRTVD